MRICTFGDLLLDVIVLLERPLAQGDDVMARTLVSGGGQAANVAAWAAALGAETRVVCAVGRGPKADLALPALLARGVEVVGPRRERDSGLVVSLVAADGERTLASDPGVAAELGIADLESAWFDCDWLHISGYALGREPIGTAAVAAAEAARELGAKISVDLSWSSEQTPARAQRLRALAPELVFASERERDAAGGLDGFALVLKRGASGFTADGRDYPAAPGGVVDPTGAGDALAAGYLLGGPELALQAAARCVATAGALP